MNTLSTNHQRCAAVAALAAVGGCGVWLLYTRQNSRKKREVAELRAKDVHDFEWLSDYVSEVSDGRLRLVDTPDRGRCLVAAQDLSAGCKIRDVPIVPHGSDEGIHLSASVKEELVEAKWVSSSDLLAALDFLASLVASLAAGGCTNSLRALWLLYRFPGNADAVPMIRRWHNRWRSPLSATPIEQVEAAWQRVVPNWRRLLVLTPRGRWCEDEAGNAKLILAHEAVCGLWLLMALCEHSCDPSCALMHDGRDLWFISLRSIQAGEAVTTSYLNLGGLCQPWQMRQEQLKQSWNFDCGCTRCAEEASDSCSKQAPVLPNDQAALFKLCHSPPDLADEEGLRAFGNGLRKLQGMARELFRGAAEPIAHSLLLVEALMLPQSSSARESLLSSALALHENSDSVACDFAAALQDGEALMRHVRAEGIDALIADGMPADDSAGEASPATVLQLWYHRHFAARSWSRRHVKTARSDGHYVASAVANAARGVAYSGKELARHFVFCGSAGMSRLDPLRLLVGRPGVVWMCCS